MSQEQTRPFYDPFSYSKIISSTLTHRLNKNCGDFRLKQEQGTGSNGVRSALGSILKSPFLSQLFKNAFKLPEPNYRFVPVWIQRKQVLISGHNIVRPAVNSCFKDKVIFLISAILYSMVNLDYLDRFINKG